MKLKDRIAAALKDSLAGLSLAPAAILLSAGGLLLIQYFHFRRKYFSHYFGSFEWTGQGSLSPLYPFIFWQLGTLLMLGIIPFLIGRYLLKLPPQKMGFALPKWNPRSKWMFGLFLGGMIPIVIGISFTKSYLAFYPECKIVTASVAAYLIYELGYLIYFMAWEFFYRGYILFGLEPSIGRGNAALVSTMLFAVMHFSKPEAEALGALVAGLALAALAFETGSFLPCAILHWLIAASMNVSAILQRALR